MSHQGQQKGRRFFGGGFSQTVIGPIKSCAVCEKPFKQLRLKQIACGSHCGAILARRAVRNDSAISKAYSKYNALLRKAARVDPGHYLPNF